jgi:hypothetical protein
LLSNCAVQRVAGKCRRNRPGAIRNQQVRGSSPRAGSRKSYTHLPTAIACLYRTAAAFYLNWILQTTNTGAGSIFYSMTIVAAVSFAASVLPARRTARISPLLAIRERA